MSINPLNFASTESIGTLLDQNVFHNFMSALGNHQQGKVCADYVWIGGSMADLRSKTKVLDAVPTKASDLPHWNYDGSSTGQAPGTDWHIPFKMSP